MKKKHLLHSALLATACTASLSVPSRAQDLALPTPAEPAATVVDTTEGKIINSVDVRYSGSSKVDKDRILSRLSLQKGQPYSKDREEADIKSLVDSGDVENVSINTTEAGGGINVVITVEARAGLGDVTFVGNSLISSDKLRTVVEDFKTGANVENSKLQTATRDIEDYYKKKGFSDVTVNYSVEPAANGFSRVIFKIDEGQKGYLRNLSFEGNNGVSSSALKKVMKADNRGLTFWSGAKLDQEKLDTDRHAIESYYQDQGYVNAKVTGMDKVRVDDKKVDLVVKISEGEVFTVTGVDMSGVKSFNAGDLIPAFNLENGKIFSGKNMKEDMATIKSYYGSRGYADVRVTPQIKNTGAGQIAVTYAVEEGSIYKINEIRFTGNTATKDEVMRRELAVIPGETYNSNTLEVSERRLRGLGYFKDVTVIPSEAPTPGFKDIGINVTEQQTGQLNFGAGFSSIDNLVGFVDLRQSNFDISSWPPVGAGQRFNMNLKIGTRRKDVTVGWYEPWLFGNPLGFGVDGFYNQKTFLSDVFDQTNLGADIYFRKKLDEAADLRLQLLSENVTIDGIDPKASPEIKNEAGDYFHNEITLTYNYETRDDMVIPRKGFKFAADISAAFGDVQDVGFGLQFYKPFQLPLDMIFAVNGAYETVDGSNVPIFERTFLGGANNLRGFNYRDVGPKDATGEPLGGRSSWFLTTELTFPIVERVRGAVFYDVGAVDAGSFAVGGGINSDYGIGLRLNLPIFGPLKLDYGIPIQGDKFNADGGRFQISVDTKF